MVCFIKKHAKKITSLVLIGALALSTVFYGFSDKTKTVEAKTDKTTNVTTVGNTKAPKYVFFFIGDG